jgi:hypothetical protein
MEIKELWRLPVSSDGHIGKVRFMEKPGELMVSNVHWRYSGVLLLFDLDKDDKKYNGGIVFGAHQVYRYTSETFAKPLPGSLDTLVEYTHSAWLSALFDQNREVAISWGIRHFDVYLNGYGLLEVIAQDFEILTILEGPLEERFFAYEKKGEIHGN